MRTLIVFAVLAASAYGQVASAVLSGRVTDESGSPASGVLVALINEATGFQRAAATNSQGEYRVAELAPGEYSIRVAKDGFREVRVRHVALEVNGKARLDFTLNVAGSKESVTVEARLPRVQTDGSSVGYRLDAATIGTLPLASRNIVSLVTLGPGAIPRHLGGLVHDVVNDIQEGSRGAVALNPPINGARSTMNSFLLDGADTTDRTTYAISIYPPMESVQEFRILSSLPGAEFPQSGGGVVDVVTKSGSRDFHGSVFEHLRNEATDARNFFDDPALTRPIFRQNQFGGSLGGPLPFARSFFFATYEGLRQKSGTSSLNLVPDAALRDGLFAGRNTIYDPSGTARLPFPNNAIPDERIDPIASAYLASFEPLPNRSSADGNYLDATPNENRADSVSGRVDHQFNSHSILYGRYTLNAEHNRVAGAFPLRPTAERMRAQQAAVGHTLAMTNWLNEARLSFTRLRTFDLPESAFQTDIARELGIANAPSDPFNFGLPFFLVTNFSLVADSPTLPQMQRDNSWHASDGLSVLRGRHTLKAGFSWTHFLSGYLQSRLTRGQYIFTGAFTSLDGTAETSGDAFADFLLGSPQVTKRSVGSPQAYLRENSYAGYLADDWRVSSRLTINLGVRYEYFSPFSETQNKLLNLAYRGTSAPQLVPVDPASAPDKNNLAPRVGLAYRLPSFIGRGATVFRAGYGIFFSPVISLEVYDLVLNGIGSEDNETDGAAAPVLSLRNGFPQTQSTGLPSYFGLDPAARTPYVQQWNAGIQRELAGGTVLEIAYIGSKGTKLGRFRQFNTPLHVATGENLAPRAGDLQSLRPFPALGGIVQRQHISNSSYNSLQVKAEKRMSRRFALLASFVWSKSIDDADTIIPGQYDSIGAQDERNLRLERGLSFFNVGRRISAGFVSGLPSAPVLKPAFRNWRLSGIVTLQDGTPLNPAYFAFDPANSGTPNRPDVVPGQVVQLPRSERTPERFFNTGAFSAPAPYTFGNAGRDTIPGPGNNVFDFSLAREFRMGESSSVSFEVDAFNVFNHPNWGIPGPYPDFGPFFGKIFTTGEPRRMQASLRFEF